MNELLYRRVDIEDVVDAHRLALERAPEIGFGRYIVSATTPFSPTTWPTCARTRPAVVRAARTRTTRSEYARRGWQMFPSIERVYANERARAEIGLGAALRLRPRAGAAARRGEDHRSPLALAVGAKGYHAESTGP